MKFYTIIYPCLDHKQTESKAQHITDNNEENREKITVANSKDSCLFIFGASCIWSIRGLRKWMHFFRLTSKHFNRSVKLLNWTFCVFKRLKYILKYYNNIHLHNKLKVNFSWNTQISFRLCWIICLLIYQSYFFFFFKCILMWSLKIPCIDHFFYINIKNEHGQHSENEFDMNQIEKSVLIPSSCK